MVVVVVVVTIIIVVVVVVVVVVVGGSGSGSGSGSSSSSSSSSSCSSATGYNKQIKKESQRGSHLITIPQKHWQIHNWSTNPMQVHDPLPIFSSPAETSR